MYLTAHHVISPSSQAEGFNSFFYVHGPYVWDAAPPAGIPDNNPGELMATHIEVPPPGNRVRSYLDVVAPDETPWSEIHESFIAFASQAQQQAFPWVGVVGRCLFRINLELGLAQQWHHEIANLYRAAQTVRVGG
jgi:hypothetical protein